MSVYKVGGTAIFFAGRRSLEPSVGLCVRRTVSVCVFSFCARVSGLSWCLEQFVCRMSYLSRSLMFERFFPLVFRTAVGQTVQIDFCVMLGALVKSSKADFSQTRMQLFRVQWYGHEFVAPDSELLVLEPRWLSACFVREVCTALHQTVPELLSRVIWARPRRQRALRRLKLV